MDEIITEKTYPIQKIWILKFVINSFFCVFVILAIFIFIIASDKSIDSDNSELYYDYGILVILAVLQFCYPIYAILKRATFHYSFEEQFLVIRQGILSKQIRHTPYGVIQNIFVKQSIFDRIFGIASLAIENASLGAGNAGASQQKVFGMRVNINTEPQPQVENVGSSGNKVNIPGLKKQNAEVLKAIILQKMKENPIEDSQSGL